jgi:para-aminobenzoate synthetase component 1
MVEPIVREIEFVDPLSAFSVFADEPYAALLDAPPGSSDMARHAIIAARPFLTLTAKDGEVCVDGACAMGDPFDVLEELLARYPVATVAGLPPFQGGALGYFGYDLCHYLEDLPGPAGDDMAFPDMMAGLYDAVAVFDIAARRAWVVSSGWPEVDADARARRAAERADALSEILAAAEAPAPPVLPDTIELVSNFTRGAYEAAVARVVDYIWAGDVFQVNLSQRFRAELPADFDRFGFYRRLRAANPAPFAAYLGFGDVTIASSSPERFVKIDGDAVETRPIKGTRPRGATPEADAALAKQLTESEKDLSENVMIVDLLRNDLSRVCRDHTVEVPELCALESYATVHHLVSTVTGRLEDGKGPVDLLRAAFPGGSITGAPKVRAMEIIAELEPTRRGPYCGAIGYIGFDGAMDTSIAIRVVAFKDDAAVFQVGGGIVADSEPAAEYDETIDKARATIDCFAGGAAGS